MSQARNDCFLGLLQATIKPSTGCTEPCAIALNAATARARAKGAFVRLHLRLDEFLYKNAMGVGIPGADARGVALCAALGVTAGDAGAGFNVLHTVTPAQLAQAKALVRDGLVTVEVLADREGLFIQTELETDAGGARVTTLDTHDNIVEIADAPYAPFNAAKDSERAASPILAYTLLDMLAFARDIPAASLAFLQDGIDMNLAVAQAGETLDLGRAMRALQRRGALGMCPMTQAKVLSASASYARMCGVSLPVMTATGSGNQGITVTMTIEGVARAIGLSPEKKLRALALAHLVNLYGKAHIGNLSALCSCGVSSGLGASVAIVYMHDGTYDQMLLAARSMIGSICGMICDGAKEGCASKVELAAGLAVESAYLALENVGIPCDNGILSGEWRQLFENLGALAKDGMREANRVIVRIMQKE